MTPERVAAKVFKTFDRLVSQASTDRTDQKFQMALWWVVIWCCVAGPHVIGYVEWLSPEALDILCATLAELPPVEEEPTPIPWDPVCNGLRRRKAQHGRLFASE
jgi:hypothetical protein